MNFNRYIIKGGIATPDNPYNGVYFFGTKRYYDFDTWASANTLPVIGNVPDGVYDKTDFQPQVYINKHFGWQDCTHHISCYNEGQKLRLRLKEKKEPVKEEDHTPYYEHLTERILDIKDVSEASLTYAVERGLTSKEAIHFIHGAKWQLHQEPVKIVSVDEVVKVLEAYKIEPFIINKIKSL